MAIPAFVAVTDNGTQRAMTSNDGHHWTLQSTADDSRSWKRVAFANFLFVAVASDSAVPTNAVQTSPDGATWTLRATPSAPLCNGICFGGGVWLAAHDDGSSLGHIVMTSSDDAVTWIQQTGSLPDSGSSCAYGNGVFVVGTLGNSGGGKQIMRSTDNGVTWTSIASPADGTGVQTITFANGVFVAVYGTSSRHIMRSVDNGATWANASTQPSGTGYYDVQYSLTLNQWATGGSAGSGPPFHSVFVSTDNGDTWTAATTPNTQAYRTLAYSDSQATWIALGGVIGSGAHLFTSTDGLTYSIASNPGGSTQLWQSVVAVPSNIMSFTPPIQVKQQSSAGFTTSITVAFTSNVTAGNLLVAVWSTGGPGQVPGSNPTDSQGNTWTLEVSDGDLSGNDIQISWATAKVTGPCSLTFVAPTGMLGWNVILGEYPLQNAVADQVSTSHLGRPSVTTTVPAELIITALSDGLSGSTLAINNGFTIDDTGDQNPPPPPTTVGMASRSVSSVGTYGVQWSGFVFSAESGMVSFFPAASTCPHAFVAVTSNGALRSMSSDDGVTWTLHSTADDTRSWNRVALAGGLYVAVANDNASPTHAVMTSTDGDTWTLQTTPSARFCNGICFGAGLWLAAHDDGSSAGHIVMTSPDGVTWTQQTGSLPDLGFCCAYGNGLFVVGTLGNSGGAQQIMTSPDGVTWTSRSSPADGSGVNSGVQTVTFAAGVFVATYGQGSSHFLMSSPDGITWTAAATPPAAGKYYDVQYSTALGQWATGSARPFHQVATSTDGTNWTQSTTDAATETFQCLAFGAGTWVALGGVIGSGPHLFTSPDGLTFTTDFTDPGGSTQLWESVVGCSSGTPLSITCDFPPIAENGHAYSHTFPATGGTAPYTFSIISGSLPTGLTLNTSTGVVSGTPAVLSVPQTFHFTIQVTDSLSANASVACSIQVVAALALSCNNPPQGNVGLPYSHSLLATGGVSPYTFAITAGSLPTGLSLNTSTGLISGTPTLQGTFPFTAQVTDGLGITASVNCSIQILAALPPTPDVPGGGGGPSPAIGSFASPGQNRAGFICLPKNCWDFELERQAQLLKHVRLGGWCVIPDEYRNLLPWDEDSCVPEQGITWQATGGIITPPSGAGDQIMVSHHVPLGYQGILSGFFFSYSGSGLVQGSGDIIYRIKVQQRFLKDLSSVAFVIGSTQFPMNMTEGALLLSDQTVSAIVNVPNLSGLIQVGASTVFAGLFGFIWPMG